MPIKSNGSNIPEWKLHNLKCTSALSVTSLFNSSNKEKESKQKKCGAIAVIPKEIANKWLICILMYIQAAAAAATTTKGK